MPKSLIGVIIGKQGSNINAIKKKYGSQISSIEVEDDEASGKCVVVLYGQDAETLA